MKLLHLLIIHRVTLLQQKHVFNPKTIEKSWKQRYNASTFTQLDLVCMFRYLYDFSQECDLEDSLVFYFVYLIAGYYLFITLSALLGNTEIIFGAVLFFPATFCASVAMTLMYKKNLRDFASYSFLGNSIILTIVPYIILLCFPPMLVYAPFIGIALGLIPTIFLSMKYDRSLDKQWLEIEKERLAHMMALEKQLQKEKAIRLKNEEIKKIITKEHLVAITPIKI